MTEIIDKGSFYVPKKFQRAFRSLLLPGECIDDIFDHIGGFNFERENEIKLQKSVWGSKTMVLDKKKPKTLDAFFKKLKTEHLDSDNSSETDDQLSKKIKRAVKKGKEIENNKNKKNMMKESKHSVSSASEGESTPLPMKQSPTYSQDMFAEERSTIHVNKKKKQKLEHIMSEEDIPSSEDTTNVNRTSLDSLTAVESSKPKKSDSISGKRERSSKSPRKPSSKQNSSNISDSESVKTNADSSSEELNLQSPLSILNSSKKSMKNIKEIELDYNKFSSSDLTEDDEVYVLQCPTQVDTKKLKGLKLNLKDNSIITLSNEENKYDCVTVKENSNRRLYVALPDKEKKGMKIGIYPLAGNVIMSENLDVPFTDPIKEDGIVSTTDCLNESVSKKKKRKHKSFEDETQEEASASECFSGTVADIALNQISSRRKKQKHKSIESNEVNTSLSNFFNIKTEMEEPQVDSYSQETPSKSKKKKRKDLEEYTEEEEVPKKKEKKT